LKSLEKILLCGVTDRSPLLYNEVLAAVNSASEVCLYLQAHHLNEFVTSLFISLVNNLPVILIDNHVKAQLNSGMENESIFDSKTPVANTFQTVDDLIEAVKKSTSEITIFTSGTTGLPKRVSHNVSSLIRTVRINEKYSNDVWGFAYNPTHMAGLQVFFQAILNGNTLVDIFGKQKAEVLDFIGLYEITHLSATPSFYRLLIPSTHVFNRVKRVSLGGEKSSQGLIDALKKIFPYASITNIYATSETGTLLHADGEFFRIPTFHKELIKIQENELRRGRQASECNFASSCK
jgi:acyl-coenzyme A synthetase/AMP-(fatty) acid ligase